MAGDNTALATIVPGSLPERVAKVPVAEPVVRTVTVHAKTIGGAGTLLSSIANVETKPVVSRPYEESGWVHACLKPIAQAVASVPLVLWDGDPRVDKSAKPLPSTDPLCQLLAAPNPSMTGAQFFEAGAFHRKLDGEDLWFMLGPDGKPVQADIAGRFDVPTHIVSVRGRSCGLERNPETGWPQFWNTALFGTAVMRAPASSVVHFRDYNPDDPLRGIGDIEAALVDIHMEWQAARYQLALLKHGGDPGGTILVEGGNLAPDEAEALENEANEKLTVQNAGRYRIVNGRNIKYEPAKLSPRDMDYAKMLAWIRDKVAAIVGVPLPVIGVLDHATLNNFAQAVEMFWKGGNGIIPYLRSVEDVITRRFLARVKHASQGKLVARFDLSSVEALRADKNLQYEIALKLAQANIGLSFSDACRLVGIDADVSKLKHGDIRLVPAGLTTLERVLAEPKPEGDDEIEGEGVANAAGTKGVPAGTAVQDLALNGAQTTSMVGILEAISNRILTRDGGAQALRVAFPTIDEAEAKRLSDGVIIKPEADEPDDEPTPPGAPPKAEDEKPAVDEEKPKDDESKAAPLARDAAAEEAEAPPDEAFTRRRTYYAEKEARLHVPGEASLRKVYGLWRRKFEAGQLARIRDFAAEGFAALHMDAPVKRALDDGPPPGTSPVPRWDEDDVEPLIVKLDEWRAKMQANFTGPVKNVYARALADAAEEIGTDALLQPTSPNVLSAIEQQVIKLAEGHTSTLADQVRRVLLDELNKGPTSIGSLQEAVAETLPELEGALKRQFGDRITRANLIARDQTANAINEARDLEQRAQGVEEGEWVSARNPSVRGTPGGPYEDSEFSHFELDGKVWRLGTEIDGAKHPGLKRPKDPNGAKGDVIGCRCLTAPIVKRKTEDES